MNGKTLWQEFKSFAFKGNLIDLSVAVVIGTAFGAVINSLVKNIIMPVLSYILPSQEGYRAWKLGRVEVGVFLGELVNFLIIAAAIFLVVKKLLESVQKVVGPPPVPGEPTTKECPLCLSVIPAKAVRCAHCTADLPAPG
jgi:large conductance mechanosensitive channel